MQCWQEGWQTLFDTLEGLQAEQVMQVIYIRNEGHTVMEAINRQLCHYAYHVGQIVLLGKIMQGKRWQSLSIPKGGSAAYNSKKFEADKGRRHFTDGV